MKAKFRRYLFVSWPTSLYAIALIAVSLAGVPVHWAVAAGGLVVACALSLLLEHEARQRGLMALVACVLAVGLLASSESYARSDLGESYQVPEPAPCPSTMVGQMGRWTHDCFGRPTRLVRPDGRTIDAIYDGDTDEILATSKNGGPWEAQYAKPKYYDLDEWTPAGGGDGSGGGWGYGGGGVPGGGGPGDPNPPDYPGNGFAQGFGELVQWWDAHCSMGTCTQGFGAALLMCDLSNLAEPGSGMPCRGLATVMLGACQMTCSRP